MTRARSLLRMGRSRVPEKWLDVDGFAGLYQVSESGQVRTLSRGMAVLAQHPRGGYMRVRFHRAGASSYANVHVLVAAAFIGPCPPGLEVRHKDGNPAHNAAGNLEYGTSSQNTLDSVAHGTHNQARKTECKEGHPFDADNTKLITLPTGSVARRCRKCQADAAVRYRKRKNA